MRKHDNFVSALTVLEQAPSQDLSNEFVQGGVIGKFALQFELSWKLLKELLAYEGDPVCASGSPRDIIKKAFQYYDFMNEELWLGMLRDRNSTAHIYDAEGAQRLVQTIIDDYIPEFQAMRDWIAERYGSILDER